MMFFQKSIKRQWGLRHVILIVITLTLALLASVFVYASQVREVEINNKGSKVVVKTMGKTVEDVLKENDIKVNSGDVVEPQLNCMLGPLNTIQIKDASLEVAKINIVDAAGETSFLVDTKEKDEEETQAKEEIVKDKIDKTEKTITQKSKIPYETEKKANSSLKRGETKVVREGKNGLMEKSYKVIYRDGKEVSRTLISKKVITKAVNKIVEYGTAATLVTSRGDTIRYKKSIEMRATAYDNTYASTGKHPGDKEYGITASGIRTRPGVVAVDPRVIPLGTRLYIESVQKGVPSYGYAVAADTGGAIKGNKIDLFFESSEDVDDWGVRPVKVYILE